MKVRFHVHKDGQLVETTDWAEEHTRDVAVSMVKDLRAAHGPEAAISVERDQAVVNPKPKTYRFEVKARTGSMLVVDEEGKHARSIGGLTLQSRPLQAGEKEQVLAELKEKFPEAVIVEHEL